jgi:hypothetical protein
VRLRPRRHVHLGHRYSGGWTELDHDRNLLRTVRHGGIPRLAVGEVEASPLHQEHSHGADLLHRFLQLSKRPDHDERLSQRRDESAVALRHHPHGGLHQQPENNGGIRQQHVSPARTRLSLLTACSRFMKVVFVILSVVIIAINIFFVTGTLADLDINSNVFIAIGIAAAIYFIFVLYLALHCYISFGNKRIENHPWIQKYVIYPEMNTPKRKI